MNNEESLQDILNKYLFCMREIKGRLGVVSHFLEDKVLDDKVITVELLALQFRKIFELISLAGVVANNEEYEKIHRGFSKHYHARDIVKALKDINPDFYPMPFKKELVGHFGENRLFNTHDTKKNWLTLDQLTNYWDRCGSLLHAQNPYGKPKAYDGTLRVMPEWLERTKRLLNEHHSFLVGKDVVISAEMNFNGGDVVVWGSKKTEAP